MQNDVAARPKIVNKTHFTSEQFPDIIGFCERDQKSHIVNEDEESYQYLFNEKAVYQVKKKANKWEIMEFDGDKNIVRVSTGAKLGLVLFHALTFHTSDRLRHNSCTNIIIPVSKSESEKASAIMYYLGGYPVGLLELTPEFALIKEVFIDPNLDFLNYSYIPVVYIPWLREELKQAGIIGQDKNRTIWMYKK